MIENLQHTTVTIFNPLSERGSHGEVQYDGNGVSAVGVLQWKTLKSLQTHQTNIDYDAQLWVDSGVTLKIEAKVTWVNEVSETVTRFVRWINTPMLLGGETALIVALLGK